MMRPEFIRALVVGTDLRTESDDTVRGAADLARRSGAELHVIHAYEEPAFGTEGRDVMRLQRENRAALLAQLDRVLPAGVEATSARVMVASPSDAILQRVGEVAADLVVIGPHHTRGIADGFLGSTAERLVRTSPVPCLTLAGPLPSPLATLLVPSDLSESARGAVRVALGWAGAQGAEGSTSPAEVVVAHVIRSRGPAMHIETESVGAREELGALLDDERRSQGLEGVAVSVEVLVSDFTADELLRFATERRAQLLVMSTQGDGTILRALQGSVSSAVARRAAFPVLLVPPAVWMEDAPKAERLATAER